jgi:hypothetical protein
MLVFVNVLGSWVGMIVGAPAGATAAELGGGITSNTTATSTTTINNTSNEQINNTVNANAQSGNATVSDNTSGGGATSGNADTAVNSLNLEDDSLSLTNWFGILFINVFGSWTGNFGGSNTTVTQLNPAEASALLSHAPVYGKYTSTPALSGSTTSSSNGTGTNGPISNTSVLASKLVKTASGTTAIPAASQLEKHSTEWVSFVIIGGLVIAYITGDAIYSHRKRIKNTIDQKA